MPFRMRVTVALALTIATLGIVGAIWLRSSDDPNLGPVHPQERAVEVRPDVPERSLSNGSSEFEVPIEAPAPVVAATPHEESERPTVELVRKPRRVRVLRYADLSEAERAVASPDALYAPLEGDRLVQLAITRNGEGLVPDDRDLSLGYEQLLALAVERQTLFMDHCLENNLIPGGELMPTHDDAVDAQRRHGLGGQPVQVFESWAIVEMGVFFGSPAVMELEEECREWRMALTRELGAAGLGFSDSVLHAR